eukprot:scaffold135421_cov130-Phaeocystis_antarctica.AAC.1
MRRFEAARGEAARAWPLELARQTTDILPGQKPSDSKDLQIRRRILSTQGITHFLGNIASFGQRRRRAPARNFKQLSLGGEAGNRPASP